jgi:Zn-dependent protease with chaperone function
LRIETKTILAGAYLLQAGSAAVTVGDLILEAVLRYKASPKDLLSRDFLDKDFFLLPFLVIYLATRLLRAHRTAVITLLVASMILFGSVCLLALGLLRQSQGGGPEFVGAWGFVALVLFFFQCAVVALFIVLALVAAWVGRMRNRPQRD